MPIYESRGFPTQVSDYIEIPDIAELLLMPIMHTVDIDTAYKTGSDFQKKVMDNTKFFGKKYIYITSLVSLLTPSFSPVTNQFALDHEWHVDGNDTYGHEDIIYHIMASKTSSMTDFNTSKFTLQVEDSTELIQRLNLDPEVNKLITPQQIEPNRIYTFSNTDIHRAHRTIKPEFRYFYRVIECDTEMQAANSIGNSAVYHGNRNPKENITQEFSSSHVDKIIISNF